MYDLLVIDRATGEVERIKPFDANHQQSIMSAADKMGIEESDAYARLMMGQELVTCGFIRKYDISFSSAYENATRGW